MAVLGVVDVEEIKVVRNLIEKTYKKKIGERNIRCITLKKLENICKDYPIRIYIFIDDYGNVYTVKKFATGELKLKII